MSDETSKIVKKRAVKKVPKGFVDGDALLDEILAEPGMADAVEKTPATEEPLAMGIINDEEPVSTGMFTSGSAASGTIASGTMTSGVTFSPGGTVTMTGTLPATPIGWTSGGIVTTLPSPTPSRAATPKPSVILDTPSKRPKKILVAFLDDDDEVAWCAKVHPDNIDLDMGGSEPAPRMTLGFWLIDAQ